MIGSTEARTVEGRQGYIDSSDSVYEEGLVAGLLGAATIAVWFLILDSLAGRPFRTFRGKV